MLQLKTETLINSSSLKDRRIERSLPTTVVTLSNKGMEVLTPAVMDSGSEINIITPRCCRKLNMKGVPSVMNIVGAGGVTNTIRTEIAEVMVKDKYSEETIIECIVLNKPRGKIQSVDEAEFDENDKQLLREKLMYTHGGEIDLPIGMSRPELHEQLSFQKLCNGLSLIERKLGYC